MADPTQVSRRFLKPEVQASLLKADNSMPASEKQALIDATSAEAARALAAEAALGGRVDGEVTARQGGDQTNADAISAEATRAVGIEQGLRTDLSSEVTRATGIEGGLRTDLTSEVTDRTAADTALGGRIDSEVTRATGVEGGLRTDVDAARAVADAAIPQSDRAGIDAALAAEASRAGAAEAALGGRIDNVLSNTDPAALDSLTEVVTAFQAADDNLNGAITSLASSAAAGLATEVTDRTAADTAEAGARASADTALGGRIDSEVTRATGIEDGLRTDLTAEVTRASGIEAGIRSDLTAEVAARGTAETALGGRIDSEVSRATGIEGGLRSDLNAEIARAQAAEASAQSVSNSAVQKAGDTMSGNLKMDVDGGNGNKIQNLADPTAAMDAANMRYVLANGSISKKELFVLAGVPGSAPTNNFIDLAYVAKTDSISFLSDGLELTEGSGYDYTVNYTGGAGGKSRISFEPNLISGGATPLLAGDVVVIKYGR